MISAWLVYAVYESTGVLQFIKNMAHTMPPEDFMFLVLSGSGIVFLVWLIRQQIKLNRYAKRVNDLTQQ